MPAESVATAVIADGTGRPVGAELNFCAITPVKLAE